MSSQIDLDTLSVGGTPSLWIFTDEWGTDKSPHKDNELFRVEGFSLQTSNDGSKEFPIIELTKILHAGINEVFKCSLWALKSKEKISAKELQGKYIFLAKNGTRLMFKIATDTEIQSYENKLQAELIQEQKETQVLIDTTSS